MNEGRRRWTCTRRGMVSGPSTSKRQMVSGWTRSEKVVAGDMVYECKCSSVRKDERKTKRQEPFFFTFSEFEGDVVFGKGRRVRETKEYVFEVCTQRIVLLGFASKYERAAFYLSLFVQF